MVADPQPITRRQIRRLATDTKDVLVAYLKTGDRLEVIKAMELGRGFLLLHVRDESGERVQVFSADEIDRIEKLPDEEPKAA